MTGFRIQLAILALMALVGCRSPEAWHQEADQVAGDAIAEFQKKAFGETRPFTIERPSDRLRKKLMVEQNLPTYTNAASRVLTNAEPVKLDKIDCLQVAARNSNDYQDQKEEVFRSALALDLEREAYRSSWSGLIGALFSSERSDDEIRNTISGDFTSEISRKLKSGATIAGKLGIDVIKLLTLDESSSFGVLADATITLPLLRGSGREIVTEPLTQAERNLMYSLWEFERYRRSFSVQIISEYFAVLQTEDELRNARESVERLEQNLARSEEMAKAGRLPEVEVDQTRQDLLRARTRMVTAGQNAQQRMDSFKQTLGLPVDAAIELDKSDLDEFADLNPGDIQQRDDEQSDLIRKALGKRLDLRVTFEKVADAERQILVARDALRAGMDFQLSASSEERRYEGTDTADLHLEDANYSAGLDLDLPWDQTEERNSYRLQILSLDRAVRSLEDKVDQVKSEVRDALRTLVETRKNYVIQREALKLARRRVDSTRMFLDAGRASTRDVLEAEEALVSAKNAVTEAVVSYQVSRLQLLNDTGSLEIVEEWGVDI